MKGGHTFSTYKSNHTLKTVIELLKNSKHWMIARLPKQKRAWCDPRRSHGEPAEGDLQ